MPLEVYTELDLKVPPAGLLAPLEIVFDGGGQPLSGGIKVDWGPADRKLQIVEWTLISDQMGSLVIDVWKDSYANFPPTGADTITASAKPTLTSANKNRSSVLTGWTTIINVDESLRFNIDSVNALTRAVLTLRCKALTQT